MQMRITRSRTLQKLGVDSIDIYPPVCIDMECNFVIQDVIKYMESNVRARNTHHNGPSVVSVNLIKTIGNKYFSIVNFVQEEL